MEERKLIWIQYLKSNGFLLAELYVILPRAFGFHHILLVGLTVGSLLPSRDKDHWTRRAFGLIQQGYYVLTSGKNMIYTERHTIKGKSYLFEIVSFAYWTMNIFPLTFHSFTLIMYYSTTVPAPYQFEHFPISICKSPNYKDVM